MRAFLFFSSRCQGVPWRPKSARGAVHHIAGRCPAVRAGGGSARWLFIDRGCHIPYFNLLGAGATITLRALSESCPAPDRRSRVGRLIRLKFATFDGAPGDSRK